MTRCCGRDPRVSQTVPGPILIVASLAETGRAGAVSPAGRFATSAPWSPRSRPASYGRQKCCTEVSPRSVHGM
jgi:hypothetical protein